MDVFLVVIFTLLTAAMCVGLIWKAVLFFNRYRTVKSRGYLDHAKPAEQEEEHQQ